ncbi:MAG: hypothetical protein ACRDRU_14610 [Pseudonocardiaceae bacterium]
MCGAFTDPGDSPEQPQLLGDRVGYLTDPGVQVLDHPGEVVEVVGVQSGQQRVMVTEAAGTRHGQIRDLGAHHPAGQLGQHARVAFPGDECLDHVPRRERGDAGGHRLDCDAAVLQDCGQPLPLSGP